LKQAVALIVFHKPAVKMVAPVGAAAAVATGTRGIAPQTESNKEDAP
jgi:hypothetical protein